MKNSLSGRGAAGGAARAPVRRLPRPLRQPPGERVVLHRVAGMSVENENPNPVDAMGYGVEG